MKKRLLIFTFLSALASCLLLVVSQDIIIKINAYIQIGVFLNVLFLEVGVYDWLLYEEGKKREPLKLDFESVRINKPRL